MKFRMPSKNSFYQFSYDPYRLYNRINNTLKMFSDVFEFDYESYLDNYYSYNVKDVFSDKKAFFTFTKGEQVLKFQVQIPELTSNNSLNVRFNAFFPKKMTDSLFSFSEVKDGNGSQIRVNIRLFYARTLDIFISEKKQTKMHLTDNFIVQDKMRTLSNLAYDDKIYEESKEILDAFGIRPRKPETVTFERGRKLINTLFHSSLAPLYFRNEFEMILYGFLLTYTSIPPYSYKTDTGISLVHKRLLTEEDILYYSITYSIIQPILTKIKNLDKKNSAKQIELTGLMSNIGLYEQFVSPLAYVSNLNRVDPLEPLGCIYKGKAEYVQLNLRDIHPSYVYNFDPYTQSDKEKTGVYNWLSCSSEIDQYGRFKNLLGDEYVLFSNAVYNGIRNSGLEIKKINTDIDLDSLPMFTRSLYEIILGKYIPNYDHPFYKAKVMYEEQLQETEEVTDENPVDLDKLVTIEVNTSNQDNNEEVEESN